MRYSISALALLLAGCSREEASFQPGQWKFSFNVLEDRQSIFRGAGGKCIDEGKAAELPVIILSQTALGQCTVTQAKYTNGKLSLDATCEMTGPSNKVLLQGSYTATSFETDLTAQLEFDGSIRHLSGVLSAHRVGDCAHE